MKALDKHHSTLMTFLNTHEVNSMLDYDMLDIDTLDITVSPLIHIMMLKYQYLVSSVCSECLATTAMDNSE